MRRQARDGWSERINKRRKKIGRKVTLWRKLQGQTGVTALTANLQIELAAAKQRVEELEKMNKLLEEELESQRQHERDVAGMNESPGEDSSISGDDEDHEDARNGAFVLDPAGSLSQPSSDGTLMPDENGEDALAEMEAWLAQGAPQSPLSDMSVDS